MKCPKCGAPPTDQVLMSDPLQYQCSQCDYYGPEGPWMEHAKREHAERLQAARDGAGNAAHDLYEALDMADVPGSWNVRNKIEALLDAKIELALLERDS